MTCPCTEGDEEEEQNIAVELEVLERFSAHKNIARFFGAYLNVEPIQMWSVCARACVCDVVCVCTCMWSACLRACV